MSCKRVVIINEGRIVAEDTPERLTDKDSSKIALQVKGPQAEVVKKLQDLPGIVKAVDDGTPADQTSQYVLEMEQGQDVRDAVAGLIVGCGWSLLEMRSIRPSLEDVFIRLVTDEETGQ